MNEEAWVWRVRVRQVDFKTEFHEVARVEDGVGRLVGCRL